MISNWSNVVKINAIYCVNGKENDDCFFRAIFYSLDGVICVVIQAMKRRQENSSWINLRYLSLFKVQRKCISTVKCN